MATEIRFRRIIIPLTHKNAEFHFGSNEKQIYSPAGGMALLAGEYLLIFSICSQKIS